MKTTPFALMACVALTLVAAPTAAREKPLSPAEIRVDDETVLDTRTGRLVASRATRPRPARRVVVAPPSGPRTQALTGGHVGTSERDDAVEPFDLGTLGTGTPIDIVADGDYPYDATIRPGGAEVWLPGAVGDHVVIIDRDADSLADSIPVGEYPIGVAFNEDGSLALVSSRFGESVTVIDAPGRRVIRTIDLPGEGGNIAFDPFRNRFIVVEWFAEDVYEVAGDGSRLIRTIPNVGDNLWHVAVAPDCRGVYVTDRLSGTDTDLVRVLHPIALTEVRSVEVGGDPWGIDVTLDGRLITVACEDTHELHVIETECFTSVGVFLEDDAESRDVDIDDATGLAYVTGGEIGFTGRYPVHVVDLALLAMVDSFVTTTREPNVIAVQEQLTMAQLAGTATDADGDGVFDVCDNCLETPNPLQADADIDGRGDACDCPEPSALDQLPTVPPLTLARTGVDELTLSWEWGPDQVHAVYRGDLDRLHRDGDYTHAEIGACQVPDGAVVVPTMAGNGYFLAVQRCCLEDTSSFGRDSDAGERPGPTAACAP